MKIFTYSIHALIIFLFSAPIIVFAQIKDLDRTDDIPYVLRKQYSEITYHPVINYNVQNKEKQDWAAIIDSVWGPGQSVDEKLAILDIYLRIRYLHILLWKNALIARKRYKTKRRSVGIAIKKSEESGFGGRYLLFY